MGPELNCLKEWPRRERLRLADTECYFSAKQEQIDVHILLACLRGPHVLV